ncbi:MAG TPA: hypothetical protein VIL49_04065 [Capillimicrobium sp.]|jgi:hypothetical protein
MGLLDDAIREHLELKRRHGADPGEVARQEHEALGPARRAPEPLEVAQADPAAPAPQAEAPEAPDAAPAGEDAYADPQLIDPQVDAPVYEDPAEHQGAVAMGDAPAAEPAREPVAEAEPADIDWEAPPRQEPEPEPEPEPADHGAGQPTVAFDAADVAEAQRRPQPAPADPPAQETAEEDVLEETPDFLQETPEHDRLWFEQRPPRDFDFDK